MRTINWGIIGCGNISSQFATGLMNMQNTNIMAVASRDKARGEEFGKRFGAQKIYNSYEDIVMDDEIDVIYIGTPHSEHFSNAALCIKNGKSVLVEKAFTRNSSEAKRLIQLAKEHNVFLMEAMWTKFMPVTKQVKEWIKEGRIGEIVNMQINFGFRREMPNTHRLMDPKLAGGALLDVGVYPVTYAVHMMDELPVEIVTTAVLGETGVDVRNSTIFKFRNGALATLNSAVNAEVGKSAVIIGEKGRIEIPQFWTAKEAMLYDQEGNLLDTAKDLDRIEGKINGYEYEAYEVNQCIIEGKLESDIVPLEDTLAIINIMDMMRKEWGVEYPNEG